MQTQRSTLTQQPKQTHQTNQTPLVIITIPCHDLSEMQRAKEAILYHLETLNPDFTAQAPTLNPDIAAQDRTIHPDIAARGYTLTVSVPPLDSVLFRPDEACDIIRQTLAQSLTFVSGWTCTLQSAKSSVSNNGNV